MTPRDRAALEPILRIVAETVRSRPGAAMVPGARRLVREKAAWLVELLRRSPALRAHAAAVLAARRPDARTRALAALLLSPDDGVVDAVITWLDLGRAPTADREAERHARRVADLRKRLQAERTRRAYADEDARRSRELLDEMRVAKADLEGRVAALNQRLTIEQSRWREPRTIAAGLLRTLERPPSPGDDAAARDPKNDSVAEPYTEVLRTAAADIGRTPDELLHVVRAIADPASVRPRAQAVRELDLRITPLGGDTQIGGSCLLVEAGGTRLLIDAGLRPGHPPQPPRDIGRATDGPLHGVVVTHAHNDHCGYVPALASRDPAPRILATPETVRLMPVMWADGAKLMRDRSRGFGRWGAEAPAHYGSAEIDAAARRCEEVPFGVPRRVGELTVELFPAGHILGAAGVVVRAGERRVVVTGDISGFRQESVDGYTLPDSARDADLLVLESTCCGDEHDPRNLRVGDFVREVREVCQGGGRVLIPAFALGRAQEIALLLRRHLPEVPVRIDGLAVDVSTAYEMATKGSARSLSIFGGPVAVAERPAELDTFRTGVVITTSGMLRGGPVVRWAARILPEPGSALFISGYQDEESTGGRLLAHRNGTFTLHDHGREVTVPVRARITDMRLSAHADRRGLLDIADEVGAHRTMLVHGALQRQRMFREVLRIRGHDTVETTRWTAP